MRALANGGEVEALDLPDDPGAPYVLLSHLRPSAPHLLLARDERLSREVVIKFSSAADHDAQMHAAYEAMLIAELHHPNIITIFEVDARGYYLVLERFDADMRDLIGIDAALIVDAFCQAGRGLGAAHQRGIFHRDLKPENVLVRIEEDGAGAIKGLWAKVADFGSAQVGRTDPVARATAAAEDQRAFASALWECVTGGRRPRDGEELMPAWLLAVLDRALMSEPSQQWADVTAFVDALERGRRTAAATADPLAPDRAQAQQLYEQAVSLAEDEAFSEAYRRWRGVADAFAGDHAELGRHGFALGAALFNAAREASGSARRRGFRRCVDVLADAIQSFETANDSDAVHDASSLAADACEQWMSTYPPDSPEHHPLAELARGFREHDR